MSSRPHRRAYLAVLLGLLAAPVLAPLPAHADPSLSVSGLRQEPGVVEFFLTASNLGVGQQLDPASVVVEAEGVQLPVREVVEVATFGADAPAARRLAVMVLDTSGSMFGQPMTDAVAAASRYGADVPADVEIAVVTVSTQAQLALPPAADRGEVDRVLNGLFAAGDTALYDGLAIAAGLVEDSTYGETRVLVLSDGADTSSAVTFADVRQRLLAADAAVDTVAFRTEETTTDLLAALAGDTGGQAYQAIDAAGLAGAFRSAAGAFTVRLLVTAEVPADLGGVDTRLEVSLVAGGQTVSTSVPLTLAVDPAAAASLVPVPAGGLPAAVQLGLIILVFLGLLGLGLVTLSPLLDQRQRRRRLARIDQFSVAPPPAPAGEPQAGGQVARAALALSERVVQGQGIEGRIAEKLDRAGMRLRPHEWLLLRALVCLVAVLLLALFVGPVLGLPLGLFMGWAGTELYYRWRAERRVEAFATILPDALQLIIGSLRSGFSLSQAVDAMVRELPDPIATEFGRALGETRLGVKLEDALDRVASRMKNTDLTWVVVAIRVQQQVGGNLAEVLTTTVKTIRERESLRRHVRALSAEGRLSAWILVALPVLMGTFMFSFRGEYMRPLYTTPVGLAMLLVGILLVLVGTFWMSRVIKVEV
jgi:tight adherence protein B